MDEQILQQMMAITEWRAKGLIKIIRDKGKPSGIWLGRKTSHNLKEFLLTICVAENLGSEFAYNFENGNFKEWPDSNTGHGASYIMVKGNKPPR